MSRRMNVGLCFAVLLLVGSVGARAVRAELRVRVAPPLPRVEVIPPAPSPGHYWIGGHWERAAGNWAWTGGHWTPARAGEAWIRPHWIREGSEWVQQPGRWTRIAPPRDFVEVVTDTAPPIARVEVVPAAPSADHFWIAGHWHWNGSAHAWVGGRWELARPAQVWVPEHWGLDGRRWHLYGGYWQAR